jgi:O-acetylserine/cysteine efflux transporter
MQAFFTVLLAALLLRELPTRRECVGMAIALAGLVPIAWTTGEDLLPVALGLALGGH